MDHTNLCPCGSHFTLEECCLPYIQGEAMVPTAEKLMRTRFTAFYLHDAQYLYKTTHVSQKKYTNKSDILSWAQQNIWQKLEILNSSENMVEFKAYYLDENKTSQIHHEKSTFIYFQNNWYYVDGKFY
ncbi:YchJ family protein [Flavobacterium sp.]|jgi:SEC-C motif-containing protein|uniref:YchJ family protein n=1 Tax=Flavobacterium sp. TaxID=239 RepID=UPI0037BEDB30